jgi:hypothetical protein
VPASIADLCPHDAAPLRDIGEDPRGDPTKYRDWDNIVWCFENLLECRPFHGTTNTLSEAQAFFQKIARVGGHGGVRAVWERLGVVSLIDQPFLAPLVLDLALETGLNPASLINLYRDCYRDEHPITRFPFLRYYKGRSDGEKELHVALLGPSDEGRQCLLPTQATIIKRTIDLILALTEPLVRDASPEDAKYLFLFRRCNDGSVRRMRVGSFSITVRHGHARNATLAPVRSLNLARFRPTKICAMVREGRNIGEIRSVTGHKSFQALASYLQEKNLLPDAERQIRRAFQLIQIQNRMRFEETPFLYATAEASHDGAVVYKGAIVDCINAANPPEHIKRLIGWESGTFCTRWAMCLKCPNALILRRHLPVLVQMYYDTRAALHRNLGESGVGHAYIETMEILTDILGDLDDPVRWSNQWFSHEDIEWAVRIAAQERLYTDPIVYRAVGTIEGRSE